MRPAFDFLKLIRAKVYFQLSKVSIFSNFFNWEISFYSIGVFLIYFILFGPKWRYWHQTAPQILELAVFVGH